MFLFGVIFKIPKHGILPEVYWCYQIYSVYVGIVCVHAVSHEHKRALYTTKYVGIVEWPKAEQSVGSLLTTMYGGLTDHR